MRSDDDDARRIAAQRGFRGEVLMPGFSVSLEVHIDRPEPRGSSSTTDGLMRWSVLLCAAAFSLSACVMNAYQTDITTKPYLGSVVGHCYRFAQDALAITRPMRLSLSASKSAGFFYDGWLLWPTADTVESEIG